MEKIRLVVADEETLFRECICAVLRACGDFEVVGEATNAQETVEMVRQLAPDVVVMNLAMPAVDSCRAVQLLRMENSAARLLLVTLNEDREWVMGGLRTEANGYISKRASTEELISAVRTVYRGEYFLQPSIAKTIVEDYAQLQQHAGTPPTLKRLTPREKRILEMLAEGREREDIVRLPNVEPGTVLASRARIMRKLGVQKGQPLPRYVISPIKLNVTETSEYGQEKKYGSGRRTRVGKEEWPENG